MKRFGSALCAALFFFTGGAEIRADHVELKSGEKYFNVKTVAKDEHQFIIFKNGRVIRIKNENIKNLKIYAVNWEHSLEKKDLDRLIKEHVDQALEQKVEQTVHLMMKKEAARREELAKRQAVLARETRLQATWRSRRGDEASCSWRRAGPTARSRCWACSGPGTCLTPFSSTARSGKGRWMSNAGAMREPLSRPRATEFILDGRSAYYDTFAIDAFLFSGPDRSFRQSLREGRTGRTS